MAYIYSNSTKLPLNCVISFDLGAVQAYNTAVNIKGRSGTIVAHHENGYSVLAQSVRIYIKDEHVKGLAT